MAYIGQLDHLIRAEERGRSVRDTRTIVVFDDGLVVCPVRIYANTGRAGGGVFGALWRGGRPGGRVPGRGSEEIRASALTIGSCVAFAPTWPKAELIPLAVIDKVVLTRPRQVGELTIREQAGDQAVASTYLGDIATDQVRGLLGPLLDDRLEILVAG